jgi:hypothetical protein
MGGTGGIGALNDNQAYPLSRMDKTQYAVPRQLPTSAEVISADYDPKIDVFTGMPDRFAKGGIATLHYDDGGEIDPIARMEEMNRPEAWNPESGQVKLQAPDPQDPYGAMKSVDYTIPKDQIKNYAPNIDQTTGLPTGGGAYALNDGSTMHIGSNGIVQAATPARNEYTLNKDGYYQPTGAGLTWDGGSNTLTKKIGGVDVVVDPLFTKGGYQDAKGNLRVDENGVPIPLPPAQFDSGAGKSGLSDAAPYIAAALAMAATGMPTGFEGMVPASQTLLGSMGYLGTAAAPTVASTLPTTGGITALDAGTADAISKVVASNAAAVPTLPAGITSVAPAASSTMLPGAAALQAGGGAGVIGGTGVVGGTAGMTTGQKLLATSLAAKALSGDSGGGGSTGPSATNTTTQAPPPNIASSTYNPAFTMPNMFAMNQSAPGTYYQAPTFNYNTRRAAQGGLMYQQGGVADLGGYAAGGKLLKGPGDGMSDSIVANIAGKQPARLADGEFVVPADVVSHLGNGSTDAGAKHLYKMMDRIRQARTGNSKQGKRINPNKFLPKG